MTLFYVGQPVIHSDMANYRKGWIAKIEKPENKTFTIDFGPSGMVENKLSITIAWEDKHYSRDLTESIIERYTKEAHNMKPITEAEAAALLDECFEETAKRQQSAEEKRLKKQEEYNKYKEEIRAKIPSWAKAVIVGQLEVSDCDYMTDYFATHTEKSIILGFSKHTRDDFREMRKFAVNAEETAHLARDTWKIKAVFADDFKGYMSYFYKGQISPWHDQETPENPFYSLDEAEAFAAAHPITDVTDNGVILRFTWKIEKLNFEHREKWSMGSGYYLKASGGYSTGWKVRKIQFYNNPVDNIPVGEWKLAPENKKPCESKAKAEDVTITEGTKPGYIEIRFPAKPDLSVLSSLKSAGFRWSRFNSCWYGKKENQPAI